MSPERIEIKEKDETIRLLKRENKALKKENKELKAKIESMEIVISDLEARERTIHE